MTDAGDLFDLLTAAFAFAVALTGVVLRVRRLIRLHRIVLPQPQHPLDLEYLRSVRRSTYLRLGVKSLLLVGSVVMLLPQVLPVWVVWRLGYDAMLVLLLAETLGVDGIRNRLARVGELP